MVAKQIPAIQIIHVIVQCKVIAYVAMTVNVILTSARKQFHNYKKIILFSLLLFSLYLDDSMKHLSY